MSIKYTRGDKVARSGEGSVSLLYNAAFTSPRSACNLITHTSTDSND
jgi:hypothetical protein